MARTIIPRNIGALLRSFKLRRLALTLPAAHLKIRRRMAEVTLKHVKKSFGPVMVIEDLNLDIQDHEFMVLVGPSGCGKSTALRMIAGLEAISGGTSESGARAGDAGPPTDHQL